MTGITVDGVNYKVRIVYETVSRSFEIIEGNNSGLTIHGSTKRDILGTKYSFTLNVEPDPSYPEDYDAFYEVMSKPIESHSFTMPYGQSTMTYYGGVASGSDTYRGKIGGVNRWSGLSLTLTAITPQRS